MKMSHNVPERFGRLTLDLVRRRKCSLHLLALLTWRLSGRPSRCKLVRLGAKLSRRLTQFKTGSASRFSQILRDLSCFACSFFAFLVGFGEFQNFRK